jgi:hypothetical protein
LRIFLRRFLITLPMRITPERRIAPS